eukprot:6639865-Prymnesium_polylepis.2
MGMWVESVGVRGRGSGLRRAASAARHAPATLSTASERSAQSNTLRNTRPSPQATRRCGVRRELDRELGARCV